MLARLPNGRQRIRTARGPVALLLLKVLRIGSRLMLMYTVAKL